MMKVFFFKWLAIAVCQAFIVHPGTKRLARPLMKMAVELVAEPEGGEELTPLASMPGCRVKKMDELKDVKCDVGAAYEFWMAAEADGALIKETLSQVRKEASKKANFRGFRKGQIPPFEESKFTRFSVQESIIKTVQGVVDSYGLKELQGSDGQVEVKEDLADMCKGYKVGDSLQFTATLNGYFDPEKHSTPTETTDETEGATSALE